MDKFLFGSLLGVATAMVISLVGRHDEARLKEETRSLEEQLTLLEDKADAS